MLQNLSSLEIVHYVCAGLTVTLVIALIFSRRLQEALLLGKTGEAQMGKFVLRGVTGVIFLGLLLGASVYAAYLERSEPRLTRKIARQQREIDRRKDDNKALAQERDNLQATVATLADENRNLKLELEGRAADPIDRVQIRVSTHAYGASPDEPVRFSIQHKGRCVGEATFSQEWTHREEGQVEVKLRRPIARADFASTIFRVDKEPCDTRNGRRWDAKFEVEGVLADGTTVPLISTPRVTIGSGMPPYREFVPRDREILPAEHCSVFVNIWVGDSEDPVAGGFLCEGRGMVPIGEIKKELGIVVVDRMPEGLVLHNKNPAVETAAVNQ